MSGCTRAHDARAAHDEHAPSRSHRRGRSDAGFSLVETVMAVSLLGIAAASILGGLWSAIRVSRVGSDMAKVEAVLSSASDRLTGWVYLPCPEQDASGGYLPVVQAASGAVGWPSSTVTITDIRYWSPDSPSTGSWSAENGIGADCNPAVGLSTSRVLQKITLRVTSPDGRSTRALEVVKNDVYPRASDS